MEGKDHVPVSKDKEEEQTEVKPSDSISVCGSNSRIINHNDGGTGQSVSSRSVAGSRIAATEPKRRSKMYYEYGKHVPDNIHVHTGFLWFLGASPKKIATSKVTVGDLRCRKNARVKPEVVRCCCHSDRHLKDEKPTNTSTNSQLAKCTEDFEGVIGALHVQNEIEQKDRGQSNPLEKKGQLANVLPSTKNGSKEPSTQQIRDINDPTNGCNSGFSVSAGKSILPEILFAVDATLNIPPSQIKPNSKPLTSKATSNHNTTKRVLKIKSKESLTRSSCEAKGNASSNPAIFNETNEKNHIDLSHLDELFSLVEKIRSRQRINNDAEPKQLQNAGTASLNAEVRKDESTTEGNHVKAATEKQQAIQIGASKVAVFEQSKSDQEKDKNKEQQCEVVAEKEIEQIIKTEEINHTASEELDRYGCASITNIGKMDVETPSMSREDNQESQKMTAFKIRFSIEMAQSTGFEG